VDYAERLLAGHNDRILAVMVRGLDVIAREAIAECLGLLGPFYFRQDHYRRRSLSKMRLDLCSLGCSAVSEIQREQSHEISE
jgi:hypothetical protein